MTWKKLTTSKQDYTTTQLALRMEGDNGLVDYSPTSGNKSNFVTEDRLRRIFPILEQFVDFWIAYPDKLIELLSPTDTQFKLYPFQMVTSRAALRFQRVSLGATRGVAKCLNTSYPPYQWGGNIMFLLTGKAKGKPTPIPWHGENISQRCRDYSLNREVGLLLVCNSKRVCGQMVVRDSPCHWKQWNNMFSKSFIAVLMKMIKCILLPGVKESLVATTKQQASEIGSAKIKEITSLLPLLANELDYSKGSGTTFSKDYTRIKFKNGSELDIVGVSESVRGGRRHGMLFEESAKMDSTSINEVVLPLLNIARRTKDGSLNPKEIHQQQIYVSSAGNRQSFGYDKTIEILIAAVLDPTKNFVCGFDYKVPMYYGLINQQYIEDFKTSNTYDEGSFAREYGSKWTSTVEGSLFSYDKLTSLRTIKKAEWKPSVDEDVFYVASIDVARSSARSVVEIFKVRRGKEHFTKSLVNIFLMEGRNFLFQAARIKELDMIFGFEWAVVDTNGFVR